MSKSIDRYLGKKVAQDSMSEITSSLNKVYRELDKLHNSDIPSIIAKIQGEKAFAKDKGDSKALKDLEESERWCRSALIKLSDI